MSLERKVRQMERMLASQKGPAFSIALSDSCNPPTEHDIEAKLDDPTVIERGGDTSGDLSTENVDTLMPWAANTPPPGPAQNNISRACSGRIADGTQGDPQDQTIHTTGQGGDPQSPDAGFPTCGDYGLLTDITQKTHETSRIQDVSANVEATDSDSDEQSDSGVDPMGMLSTTDHISDSPDGMLTTSKGFSIGPSSTLGFMRRIQDMIIPRHELESKHQRRAAFPHNHCEFPLECRGMRCAPVLETMS